MSTHPAQNAANIVGQAGLMKAAHANVLAGINAPQMEKAYAQIMRPSTNKTVFSAKIEVIKVANGYMVNIGRTEGYEYESHIAKDVKEVNDIIVAQMVAFRLEE